MLERCVVAALAWLNLRAETLIASMSAHILYVGHRMSALGGAPEARAVDGTVGYRTCRKAAVSSRRSSLNCPWQLIKLHFILIGHVSRKCGDLIVLPKRWTAKLLVKAQPQSPSSLRLRALQSLHPSCAMGPMSGRPEFA